MNQQFFSWSHTIGKRFGMFRSARLKLTLFYLAVLLAFCVLSTIGLRLLADHEYGHSNYVQRSEVHQLFKQRLFKLYGGDMPAPPTNTFSSVQSDEQAAVRAHLNRELVMINVAALAIGGVLAYWFAGRTLRPIEEAHAAQTRFATDASHELRTPLTNMKLENELFLRQSDFTKDEARDQVASNLEEVQRLENLSASLLDLTHYGDAALRLQPLAVDSIVEQAVVGTRKSAQAKGVQLQSDITPAQVTGHAASLTQLLNILLDNAIKYGPEKGVVNLQGTRQGGQYRLRITDEGPGIDPTDLPFIFDRLYRGDKARSSHVGGYGLGLSLAKAIAEANRITLQASNAKSGGACFTVHLPLVK